MIKTVSQFTLTALLGAGLMGCSGDVDAETDTSFRAVENVQQLQKIKFNNKNLCIKVEQVDMVSLTLTDGTELSLPRSSLDYIYLDKKNIKTDEITTTFDDVSEVYLNLSVNYDQEGCAQSVPVLIRQTDAPLHDVDLSKISPFFPIYSPVYAFKNVSKVNLTSYFLDSKNQTKMIGPYKLIVVDSILPRPENYRERFSTQQLEAAARIRATKESVWNSVFFGQMQNENGGSFFMESELNYKHQKELAPIVRFYSPFSEHYTWQTGMAAKFDGEPSLNTIYLDEIELETVFKTRDSLDNFLVER